MSVFLQLLYFLEIVNCPFLHLRFYSPPPLPPTRCSSESFVFWLWATRTCLRVVLPGWLGSHSFQEFLLHSFWSDILFFSLLGGCWGSSSAKSLALCLSISSHSESAHPSEKGAWEVTVLISFVCKSIFIC